MKNMINALCLKDKTEFFLRKVFNFYNGRINTCNNNAVLFINWTGQWNSSTLAVTRNPNIIIFWPQVIARYCDNEKDYFFLILNTVIHELHHADQILDYVLVSCDENYKTCIESAVEVQTAIYVMTHRDEILYNFGIDISDYYEMCKKNLDEFDNIVCYPYERRQLYGHFMIVLHEVITENDFFCKYGNRMIDAIETRKGNILININGNKLFIVKDGVLIDMNIFNQFMWNYWFNTPLHIGGAGTYIEYLEDGSNTSVEINQRGSNIMCV